MAFAQRRVMKMALIIVLAIVVLVGVLYWRTSRVAYESARYNVVKSYGDIEIRDYAPLVLAETQMPTGESGRNGGFGKLFNFITGSNEFKQSISMTTPVLIDSGQNRPRMAFVLPSELSIANAPKPTDPSVELRAIGACRVAVLRFAGAVSEKNQEDACTRILARMKEIGLEPLGEPQFAYYDPPWTPPFLRRNEVLVRVGS